MRLLLPIAVLLSLLALVLAAEKNVKMVSREEMDQLAKEADDQITFLTPETFAPAVEKGVWLVFYGARWCKYCKRLTPRWLKLQRKVADVKPDDFSVAKVDCTDESDFCSKNHVEAYPTIYLYNKGKLVEEYTGEVDSKSLIRYALDKAEYFAAMEMYRRSKNRHEEL
ncbi:thioredoxin-like protein [Polychytrium aggregatum]|uniref:thioredoxin-like protein n=1 Tax=Polychytrium aggregatum TaxID=110093 RepID=UPI0022FE532F|nr:thioredoxin-like protein [Polychytrium aggregatum]KAI9197367.1 thioredoxin-like protein [Polychytrium aggregatum]